MSEVGMPAEDKENSGKADNSEHPIKYNFCDYFRCQPIAFTQFILSQTDTHDGGDKQKHFGSRALVACRRIAISNPYGTFIVGTVLVIAAWLLIRAGLFKPATISLIATVMMAIWAGLQWLVYKKQCEIMRDQHSAMEKQIKLARRATKQTAKILGHMRVEQRPWLAIEDVDITVERGAVVKCQYVVHNVGNTPATITTIKRGIFPLSANFHPAQIPELPNNIEENRVVEIFARRIGIPPRGPLTLFAETYHPITEEQLDGLDIHKTIRIILYGVITYLDTFGDSHSTEFLYRYDGEVVSVEMTRNEMK